MTAPMTAPLIAPLAAPASAHPTAPAAPPGPDALGTLAWALGGEPPRLIRCTEGLLILTEAWPGELDWRGLDEVWEAAAWREALAGRAGSLAVWLDLLLEAARTLAMEAAPLALPAGATGDPGHGR